MSLILDALKKSEAERQLGRAPGLMSPMVRVSRRRGLSPWWGVLGLALAVAGGAAWWVRNAPDRVPEVATTPTPREATSAGSEPAPRATADVPANAATDRPASVAAARPADPSVSRQATAPVARPALAETASTAPAENAAMLPRDPEFDSVERESVSIAMQPATAPSARIPSTVPPIPPARSPAPSQTVPPLPAPPAVATASPPPAADTGNPAPTPQSTASEPASSEPPLEPLPLVGELMPDVRAALPALKLSMHVYTAAPEGRFVLIDGKRHVQGDRIAASLTVAQIRRDGAVLEFDGKRFLVPRP